MDTPTFPTATPEPTYQVMPDRMTVLENELKTMRQEQKFQLMLWTVLFAIGLVAFVGFCGWQYVELRDARQERDNDVAAMQKKIDDMQALWLTRLDEKTTQLTNRYDGLSERLASFENLLNWMKGREDTIKEWYPPPADGASK